MDVETAGYKLLSLIVIGVAIVIVLGVSYTNLATNKTQIQATVTCTGTAGAVCSTVPSNENYGNAINVGIVSNFSTNSNNVANTAGTNGNYVYYILFMALVIGVIIGVLAVRRSNG
jgi:ABC-type proline/glycine betaine transport system permease subunit